MRQMLAEIIEEIVALQRRRRFCIVSQSRADRSTEAFIASMLGYRADLAEGDRAKLFKQASAIRKMVEKGGGGDQLAPDDPVRAVLSAAAPIIIASKAGRDGFDTLRKAAEKRMAKLARLLPVYPWAASITGFGELGLAVVVAECPGDNLAGLADFGSPAKVWKRCGLAVIDGERQRKKSDVEQAARHGYSPRRRATVYGDIGAPLFFAKGRNYLGQMYKARRAHTASVHPDWTKAHSDNDARRYITKRLLRDLWRAWREAARDLVAEGPRHCLPPRADIPEPAECE
jgi:hypothetical protein